MSDLSSLWWLWPHYFTAPTYTSFPFSFVDFIFLKLLDYLTSLVLILVCLYCAWMLHQTVQTIRCGYRLPNAEMEGQFLLGLKRLACKRIKAIRRQREEERTRKERERCE
jgi:hypothetical protein